MNDIQITSNLVELGNGRHYAEVFASKGNANVILYVSTGDPEGKDAASLMANSPKIFQQGLADITAEISARIA